MEDKGCKYCEYESGNKPLISIKPLINVKGCTGDIKLFATTVSIDFFGDDGDEASITCEIGLGTDKSIFECTRIKYCPMCGMKL